MDDPVLLGSLICQPVATPEARPAAGAICNLYTGAAFASGEPERVTGAAVDEDAHPVRMRDVLISVSTRLPRRAWVVGPDPDDAQWATRDWIVLRSGRHDPSYLRHVLVSDAFRLSFVQAARRRGRTAGDLLQRLARIELPAPGMEEQRRIVQVLDLANGLRVRRRAMAPLLDELAQALCGDESREAVDRAHASRRAAVAALRGSAVRSAAVLDGLIGTLRDLAYTGRLACA